MQAIVDKSDLRVVKTTKILNVAMFSLLSRYTFKKITVSDICQEAQISRATFYARFTDKYDFLKTWLTTLRLDGFTRNSSCEEMESIHNEHLYKNRLILKNLITDVDAETLSILAEFMLFYFLLSDQYDINQMAAEQVVLSNFFAGGMIFYIWWQVKNKFPSDLPPMNVYLYKVLQKFWGWEMDAR